MLQTERSLKVDNLFVSALNNNVFPGASFGFSKWHNGMYSRETNFYGYAQLDPEKKELQKDSVFDLASLTKVLSTVPLLLNLLDSNKINLETELQTIFSSCPSDKATITIAQLLCHRSGLAAHRDFFTALLQLPPKKRKKSLLTMILEDDLVSTPGESCCYSDLGFILLGFIIEKIHGTNLAQLAEELLYKPLDLSEDLFYPALSTRNNPEYVSTERCPWTRKMLCGKVHDDNCRAMGGVAGHAGLFGTLYGALSMCEHFLDQWQGRGQHPSYSNKSLQRILKPIENSGWTLGFDMVSETDSSAGHYFSRGSVGHLGFTGTSFWIDPIQDCIVVLLTNRVHPTRENWKIKNFRPIFHDTVMEKLKSQQKDF